MMINTILPIVTLFISFILFIILIVKIISIKNVINIAGFLLLPISQIMSIIALFLLQFDLASEFSVADLYNYYISNPIKNSVLLFVLSAVSFAIDILVTNIAKSEIEYRKSKELLKAETERKELNKRYYDNIKKKEYEIENFKKNVNEILLNFMNDVENNSFDNTEIKNVLDSIEASKAKIEIQHFCENEFLNIVISEKHNECKEKSINLNVQIILPNNIPLEEIDIIRVFCNLLDNSISAVEKMESNHKEILISSYMKDNYLYVTTENYFISDKKTKRDKSGMHGNGLIILDEISKKYNGYFKTYTENGSFKTLFVAENR